MPYIHIEENEDGEDKAVAIFARKNERGNYDILYSESGEDVTRLDINICPVGSDFCAEYNHPNGIELTLEDVMELGIEIEEGTQVLLCRKTL